LHAVDGARLTFNFPSWSLSAEMLCYLVFPVVAVLAVRRRTMVIALVVALMCANTLYVIATNSEPWADWINQGGAFRALPGFFLGVACYLFRHQIMRWPVIRGALPLALAAFILLGWLLPVMAGLVAVYAIAILAVQYDSSRQSSLLTLLHLDRGAAYTYSCYMLHIPVATMILTFGARHVTPSVFPAGKLALLPIAISMLAVVSVLSYRYFETPLRRYLNDIFDRYFIPDIPASAALQQERVR
jgi:peptidoglycan/LPS O-acetylase OafA/YrhL